MKIKVLFFASVKEITGLSQCVIDISSSLNSTEAQTLSYLLQLLTEQFPGLNIARDQISIAINQEYCTSLGVTLKDGDVVALIPPISGG
jgi:molybdopterin converting factor subunit 1